MMDPNQGKTEAELIAQIIASEKTTLKEDLKLIDHYEPVLHKWDADVLRLGAYIKAAAVKLAQRMGYEYVDTTGKGGIDATSK